MNTKKGSKEIIQSYILTVARYEANVYTKRILTHIVAANQDYLLGQKVGGAIINIEEDLFKDREYTFDVKELLLDKNDKNYNRIYDAFDYLQSKFLAYEDSEVRFRVPFITAIHAKKKSGLIRFRMSELVYKCFADYTKGFRRLEFELTLSLTSVYSIRLYELLSGQQKPLTYTIDELKEMFQIQGKYKKINDFIRFVIEPAKKELDEKSPYSFDYEINKKGRSFHSITFYPIHQPNNEDAELKGHNLAKKVPMSWELTKEEINYLTDVYNAEKLSIKNNLDLFIQLKKKEGYLIPYLSELKTKMLRDTSVKNKFGYLINSIKNRLQEEQQHTPKIEKNTEKRKTKGGEFTSIGDLFSTMKKENNP